MPDIVHNVPIKGSLDQVFRAISTPAGLDSWWSLHSAGEPAPGAEYKLGFGPEYDWLAVLSRYVPDTEFELELTRADSDWQGTRLGFLLEMKDGVTQVRFQHLGWPEENDHYRTSCYCWAMYLRLLKRYVEHGEVVPYDDRLEV